jgi:hypothetical protein
MKLITNKFRTHSAKQFVESLTEPQNTIYYLGAHRNTPFPSDSLPPTPVNSVSAAHYEMYDELIFGKHVLSSDVVHMIRNVQWISGTVYDMYDTQTANLELTNFYVISQEANEYHVFKCLNNNGGAASTSQPRRSETAPDDDFYVTADGYQWKYMYTITASQWFKFATNDYAPVFINADVTANAVSGSIDTIIVENGGSSYRSYATGNIKDSSLGGDPLYYTIESSDITLSANDSFYENCSIYIDSGPGDGEIRTIIDYFTTGGERTIVIDHPFETVPNRTSTFIIAPRVFIGGDGSNAKARAVVNTDNGSISSIEIINRGSDYTFTSVEVVGNTGTTAVATTTSAVARAVISPPKGHGGDIINELYASKVGISVAFAGSESGTIPVENDYRKISLIKDPLFKNGDLQLTTTAASTGLQVGEIISQESTGAYATITGVSANTVSLTDIRGFFETSAVGSNNTIIIGGTTGGTALIESIDRSFETFDQRDIYQVEVIDAGLPAYGGFIEDETVVQSGLSQTLSTNVIKLRLEGIDTAYAFVDGEIVSQNNSPITATGTIVARYTNILTISSPTSYFTVNNAVTGLTSGATATVTDYDNTLDATAVAVVHEVDITGTTGTIAVTGGHSAFLLSDDETNTINSFKGQTSQAIASLTGIDSSKNKLVDGSGEIMYVENFAPITRDADQTERIKLVIEF